MSEPLPDTIFRRVIKMMRCLVQRLQESGVNGDPTAWLEHAVDFLRSGFRIGQMLENIEGKNTIERRIAKGKMVRVAHDVGVPKNLVLEFDAVRVALGRAARSDVKNKVISLPENFLELSAERIAGMLPRNDHFLVHENRHAL